MTQAIRLNAVRIDVTSDLVTTTLPDGEIVYGAPHATPEYAAHAAERGYGDDVARANRCHEVGHSLLAHWLGLKCSPTLLRVGRGQIAATEVTGLEETCLLSLERYANAMGVDLEQVAVRLSNQFTGNNGWRLALHEQGHAAVVHVVSSPQETMQRALACAGEAAEAVHQEQHERMNGK